MKILVTGANGYLGCGVVSKLLDLGNEVIATDFSVTNVDYRAECIEANVLISDNPFEEFGKPDCLLHMAWKNGFIHNSDSHIKELPLHFQFIKRMAESGTKQIAVMGTMHEIGFFEGCIDDDTACHPMTLYGISKNALRDMTKLVCNQNNVIFQWLRAYYIVGNSTNGCSIFSKIANAAQEGKTEFPFTTGQNQYDFLNYDEFCYLTAAATSQSEIDGIINVCCGYPEKLSDRVERFISENNYSIKLKYGAFPDRIYDSKAIWGNDEKIRKIITNLNKG